MHCHLLFYHNQYPNVMTELLFSTRYDSSVRAFKLFVASFLIAFKYLDTCFRVLIIIVLSFVSVLVGLGAMLNVWIFVSIILISITLQRLVFNDDNFSFHRVICKIATVSLGDQGWVDL